ncbi:acyl-CoA dehydrogenase family protein [Actinophytocola oryzae]|uniref:Alkylation response protein AidB-like acyl-CoA dehydrogenase n=1 Tax=Actinophytocola oryzae TaxID=502181 RepID=A0A4R7UQD1_9PSEU|nr:acyl-CoA dehydrogenase family protein [Actinophytocola oryzae]TDV34904.1 alkylation response protein AidB-like acyl-CoA dehydrogenase [Actinophytocola oryzae]
MNLLYTDVETDLRASVRDLLSDRAQPTAVLARCETDEPYDLALWRELTSLGAASLHVPEELGGQGASTRETAVVMEELGRTVAPVPFLGCAVLATSALLGCKPTDEVRGLLDALGNGSTVATLAISLATAPGSVTTDVTRTDGGLSGRVRSVADALPADLLLVPAQGPDGLELHAVSVSQQGVTIDPVVSLDLTRPVSDVTLDGADSMLLAGPESAEAAVDSALWTGAGLLASEQLGIAEWCLDTTVAYLKDRHQFGRPVGSFQALKHRLADVWQDLVLARAVARNAADDPGQVSASLAKSMCSTTAVHAAEEAVQLHGGIGMTWEHPAHLYLKRAKADSIALGTAGRHRQLLAPHADILA